MTGIYKPRVFHVKSVFAVHHNCSGPCRDPLSGLGWLNSPTLMDGINFLENTTFVANPLAPRSPYQRNFHIGIVLYFL